MRKSFLVSIFVILTAITACKPKEDVIRIGIAGPMTGPQAKMGADFRNGVEIAVQEWNQKDGVLGKRIVIEVGDDQADPKQAVSVANRLVNRGVVGIIGHFNSSCSIPASDVYGRAGIPMISPASTNPLLTERGMRGVFRVCGRDDQQGMIAALFVKKKLKVKSVAIIHDKTTYGQGLADEFKKSLGSDIKTVYYGGIVQGDKDFKMVLTAIKDKNPELIYFGGIYPEAGLLVRQARELGIETPFMSGDGTIDKKFVEIAGKDAAEGTFLTFSPDPKNIPTAKTFMQTYKMRFGDIGPYSIYAYDAINILLTAIKEANTIDTKAVIEKLHSLEFEGGLGRIKFDEKGDVVNAPYVIWITKSGEFVEFWKP
ncbi:MAG: branched-chain amino acid ABC transporter substrate-binding protein [Nitrospirae bacterium]|nr:branched-chain amino acid ABC transporter substrate-binding protein [Nitrospirota bacterium]